jgi:hypothetical protein
LVSGYQVSQAIHVAATLRIADLLAEGARTSDELADPTETHPDSLYRLRVFRLLGTNAGLWLALHFFAPDLIPTAIL